MMTRSMRAAWGMVLVADLAGSGTGAYAQDATAILDRAIRALGGEEKLARAQAIRWTARGTVTFSGTDSQMTSTTVVKGLDHSRGELQGMINGMEFNAVTVLA